MAASFRLRLFLLQTHGMEDDLEDDADPRWGEVLESSEVPLKWGRKERRSSIDDGKES